MSVMQRISDSCRTSAHFRDGPPSDSCTAANSRRLNRGKSVKWRKSPAIIQLSDRRYRTGHWGSLTVGNKMLNTDPFSTPDEAQSLPSWASMIDRQIDSPIPMPCDFRREERLEDAVGVFRINARSRVFYRKQHSVGIMNCRFHR